MLSLSWTLSWIRRAMLPVFAIATFAMLSLSSVYAEDVRPFLHPLFTSNMVLQRGIADPIWGWTTPGQTVTVTAAHSDSGAVRGIYTVDGKAVTAVAGPDGKWAAKIGPLAVGKTYTITVSGPQTVTLTNVLVGDVWLCSGQSNMEFGIGNAINADAEIAAANYPSIRLLMVDNKTALTPEPTFTGGPWAVCTPENIHKGGWSGFSAVGYFFGRDLYKKQHIPIGLIESDWGGTPAQAWVSAEALSTMPPPNFNAQIEAEHHSGGYPAVLEAWYAKHDAGSAPKNWADPNYDASGWKTMRLPTLWEQSGVPELANFDGIVWFRKTFDLPAADTGKEAVLHLVADDSDTAWVNGTQVGATTGYNTVRAYIVPAALLKPTGNTVAIRVLDTGGAGGIWGDPSGLNLAVPGGQPIPLAGDWQYQIGGPWPPNDPVPTAVDGDQNLPTALYNAMIAPLIPNGIKGAIWYQGEANAGAGKQYETLLPTLIGDWRTRFGVGDFPFLVVQLANFGTRQTQPEESGWAEVQNAQLLTSERLPKTGLAVTMDIGNADDIHPKNKQEVGRRLALAAEAIAYGQKGEYSGPLYQRMVVEGDKIRLYFTHRGDKLVAKGGALEGFAIAGSDGKFVWGNAKIDGNTVVVSSPSVPIPTDVRYAWGSNPLGNLYNQIGGQVGLPASLFRTGK